MKRKEQGITLIALVITIIVMLILVAVTIRIAVNGKLFEYAGKAVKDTGNATIEENKLMEGKPVIGGVEYNSIEESVNAFIGGSTGGTGEEGGEILNVELQKGNYVNYHYKDDTGADAFISCMFLGNDFFGNSYKEKCSFFPLSTLESLVFSPFAGVSVIGKAEEKWSARLGALVTVDRSI